MNYLQALVFSLLSYGIANSQLDLVPVGCCNAAATQVTDIANAGDGSGRLFIVEQAGTVLVYDSNFVSLGTFLNISSVVDDIGNEEGLLSICFHPDYETNGIFYVYFSNSDGGRKTILERHQVCDPTTNIADTGSCYTIDTILLIPQFAHNHNGGDLSFNKDGFLYLSTGDGGNSNGPGDSSQLMTNYLGKIIKMEPMTSMLTAPEGIYGLGLRNPWRFSFDRYTGDIWIADVGQGAREEISHVTYEEHDSLLNYGWTCFEGEIECPGCGSPQCTVGIDTIFPVWTLPRSQGNSITGGFVLRGYAYNDYAGEYVFADYGSGNTWTFDGDTVHFIEVVGSITTFGEDENGKVYASRRNGTLYEVVDESAIQVNTSCVVNQLGNSGSGSLRDRIDCASPGDTIVFDKTFGNDTVQLTSSLTIDKNLTIYANVGHQMTIDGSSAANTIHVMPGAEVNIHGITILGGMADGGAIWNEGKLTLGKSNVYPNPVSTNGVFLDDGELDVLENTTVHDQ